jgi:hypothetical protein
MRETIVQMTLTLPMFVRLCRIAEEAKTYLWSARQIHYENKVGFEVDIPTDLAVKFMSEYGVTLIEWQVANIREACQKDRQVETTDRHWMMAIAKKVCDYFNLNRKGEPK